MWHCHRLCDVSVTDVSKLHYQHELNGDVQPLLMIPQ